MSVKERVRNFKSKHPEITIKKIMFASGILILVTTAGALKIKMNNLETEIESLMSKQGVNGLCDGDLDTLKNMYGDVRELNNAALGIAAKGLDPSPTLAKATSYEKTVLEGLTK